ncbi:hypothetical protein GCM10010102_05910 [Promicromonospora citrea]|uniref:Uncharacterized protein n=1 Tax=Promicromonospora citrea TaxID=43677 RepID=A0A8H9GE44_9MICO|nr:hypothetical protein GCM10010102_05910 [Promicromonospora citrea]
MWFSGAVPSTFHWPFGRAGRFVGRVVGWAGAVFTMGRVLFDVRAGGELAGVVRVVGGQEAVSQG